MSIEKDAQEYARLKFVLSKLSNDGSKEYRNIQNRVNALEKKLRKKVGKQNFDNVIGPLVNKYFKES